MLKQKVLSLMFMVGQKMITLGSKLSDWADERQGELDEGTRLPMIHVVDIQELNLPTRTHNVLMLAGITSIDMLKSLSIDELCRIKNFGHKDCNNVLDAMEAIGYKVAR